MKIRVEYIKCVNYALVHNGNAMCQYVELVNDTADTLRDVSIRCEGEYLTAYESPVYERVAPGECVRLSEPPLQLQASQLLSLTERVVSTMTLSVLSAGQPVAEQVCELTLMPYNHWLGTTILPQSLASFVTPNHPAVAEVVMSAAEVLQQRGQQASLTAYQTGNVNVVRMQVAAVFAALHRLGIVYRPAPPSFETAGQRITMPDQVLATKLGNCIELALLFASVLESIGLNCGILLDNGHAYLGVWLVDDCCPFSTCDDAAYIEKKCSRGIDEMMLLECTAVTQSQPSFEAAEADANRRLADPANAFSMMVDVHRCRLEHFLPLPTRILQPDGTWAIEQNGLQHGGCDLDVTQRDRYDLSHLRESTQELTRYDIWERKLLDFSLRNMLLNLSLRRRAVQFVSFDIDRLEDHLQDNEEYVIECRPQVIKVEAEDGARLIRSKTVEQLHDLVSDGIEHHRLYTYMTEGETQSVLKNIYRGARNAIEETGANSLFLSIGTLRWYETPLSEVPRYAPLLLLPVEMVYKKGKYYVRKRDEEIMLNITLIEFLRQNYDIRVPGIDPLPLDEHGVDVPLIFAAIREALKEQKGWDIEEESVLGTFSFSKFLMWNDVHNHRPELSGNNIVSSLVAGHLTWQPQPLQTDLKQTDSDLRPNDLAMPVAADSSQMAAVIAGGMGQSFILYGPPGTGKSQTITNLIANALYQGKRVLFVAEKMAALSVVQKRLAKIGLDAFCLELHSNKGSKRHVLEQLDKALKVAHIVTPASYAETAARLYAERRDLQAYMLALHDADEADGLSLYDCIVRYDRLAGSPLAEYRHEAAADTLLREQGEEGVTELLKHRLAAMLRLVGQPSEHPLCGLHVTRDMLADPDAARRTLREAQSFVAQCNERRDTLASARQLRDSILLNCSEDILREDAQALYDEWREVKARWFLPRFFAKRKMMERLRRYDSRLIDTDVDRLLERLLNYSSYHAQLTRLAGMMLQYQGVELPPDALPSAAELTQLTQRLEHWQQHLGQMRDWLHYNEYADELRHHGMACVVEALEQHACQPDTLRDAYLKAVYAHKADTRMRSDAQLLTFEGMMMDDKVRRFKQLTADFEQLTQKELYARLAARVPRVTDSIDSSSEIGLLSRNISNGGRGQSLRDLFDQIPTLLPRLCPCMLMSPISVAQYLTLTQDKFDLVVFDEASQMPTSEAVGAIARGKSLIVVGDPKQMPPTSFFSSTNVDEEEAAIDDMESILEDCRTLQMPSLQLNWHYRSRHESLIAFSNNEYYDGQLITFPSVDDQRTQVQLVPVNGYYDMGGKRHNRAEAEAIVAEVARRLRAARQPDGTASPQAMSLGVIAFSVVQQALIEDLLQDLLDGDAALREVADTMYEPIFVKNLENVQGDERDVILFSVGYGPDREGKVSMNFGPLNQVGGERRLNVAVSRARHAMLVFSTLKSSQIDLRRTQARGVEGLKHFLEYAESSMLASAAGQPARHGDGVIAEQIAQRLQAEGYEAKVGVGRSQFHVDVAVSQREHPEVYRLGILLDGLGYRDTQTTRDREVVQPSVLEGLGWQLMRVWSVDWYVNRQRVMARILEQLAALPPLPEGGGDDDVAAPQSLQGAVTTRQPFDVSAEELEQETPSLAEEYKEYKVDERKALRMTDDELVGQIVAQEQPIVFGLLCRRVCALRQQSRVTPKVQQALAAVVSRLCYSQQEQGQQVVWLTADDSRSYLWYRPDSGRDIADIPQVEVRNAVRETLTEQCALPADSLMLLAARKLGFTRRGVNVDQAMRQAIAQIVADGEAHDNDGTLSIV